MIIPEFPDEVPPRVPDRTVREFAALLLVIFGGLFAVAWYRRQAPPAFPSWITLALAMLVGLSGLVRPGAIRPVYLGMMALAKPIGHVIGLALLAVVYYGVLTPIAWLFRAIGRDGLGRFRTGSETYWVDRAGPRREALLAPVSKPDRYPGSANVRSTRIDAGPFRSTLTFSRAIGPGIPRSAGSEPWAIPMRPKRANAC